VFILAHSALAPFSVSLLIVAFAPDIGRDYGQRRGENRPAKKLLYTLADAQCSLYYHITKTAVLSWCSGQHTVPTATSEI